MKIFVIILCILLLVYMLAIMPRMFHRADQRPFLNRYYAHRGLHNNRGNAPENSLAAFQKAVDKGYGIELDVRLSKDRIPVVIHDAVLNRVCNVKGKVEDYTYEELKNFPLYQSEETIPSFKDVLKLVDGRVPLIVELKIDRTDTSVCNLANLELSRYRGIYCIESFNPLALIWYRKHQPQILRGQLSMNFSLSEEGGPPLVLRFILKNLLANFLTKPDFIAFDHHCPHCLSRVICRNMYGALSVAWTIKSQEQLEKAKEQFDLFIFDSFIPTSTLK